MRIGPNSEARPFSIPKMGGKKMEASVVFHDENTGCDRI